MGIGRVLGYDQPRLARPASRTLVLIVAGSLLATVLALSPIANATAAAQDVSACKLPAPAELRHSGFPLGDSFVAGTGEYRAAILFVDFADRPNTESTQDAFARVWTPEAKGFIERQSQRRIEVEAVAHHEWLHLDTTFEAAPQNPTPQAVALADIDFDFSDIDAVWVVFERSVESRSGFAWTAPRELPPIIADDGNSVLTNGVVLGTASLAQTPLLDIADVYVAHEVLHTLGLPDLSNFASDVDHWRFVGNFDPMGNIGGFAGGQFGAAPDVFNGGELFAWQRWQLGWVDDAQIHCGDASQPIEVALTSLIPRGGPKAAVMVLGPTQALVVEARVQDRFDRRIEREGVLVYLVDSTRFNANGSIQVQNAVAGRWPSALDLLQPGESLSVAGIAVNYLQRQGDTFMIQVLPKSCGGLAVTIDLGAGDRGVGTAGDDVILGTDGDDVIDGLDGNDVICAGDGADVVHGGAGNDWIRGGAGPDTIRGNAGSDDLAGGDGSDRILGGIGADVLAGDAGDDFMGGFGGDDMIEGGPGADVIFGGFGADVIHGGPGADRIRGLIGDDEIHGGSGSDEIDGDRGNDLIDGGGGADVLRGGNANDIVRGGFGDDQVSGGKADDVLSGGGGTDVCSGNLETIADRSDGSCEQEFGLP